MLRFLPLVFIISTDAAIPSVAIDTCPSDQVPPLPNPYDLDCTAFSTSYADSATEVCCYSSVTDTSGVTTDSIEKYANTCYYDCNQPSNGGGYSYYSMANYYCGACCNTAAAAVDPNNCTDPDNTTSVDCTTQGVDQDWGFCPDYTTTGDQCTSCDPAVSDPCLYRGSAYECVSDDSSQPICNKCTHPCEGVSNCEYSASGDTCDVTTTDTDGNVVGTGEVGTCQYTDLANYDLQCLTCEPNPTTTAAATTSDPCPANPTTTATVSCPNEPTSPQCTSTGGDCVQDVGGQTVTGTCSMDSTDRCWFCDTTTTNPCPDEPVNTAGIAYCTAVDDDCVDDTGVTGTCDYGTGSNCFTCYPDPTTTATVTVPDPCADVYPYCTAFGGFCDVATMDSTTGAWSGTGEIGSCQYDANQCLDCVACADQLTTCSAVGEDCNEITQDANGNTVTGAAGTCDYDTTAGTNAYGCFTCYPNPTTTATVSCPDEPVDPATGVASCTASSGSCSVSGVSGTCSMDADGCWFCDPITDPCTDRCWFCAVTDPCDVGVSYCTTYGDQCDILGTGFVGLCNGYDSNDCLLCCSTTCTALDEDCDTETGAAGTCVYDTTSGSNTYGCFTCDPNPTTTATVSCPNEPTSPQCTSTGGDCVQDVGGQTVTGTCSMGTDRCWFCAVTDPCDGVSYCTTYGDQCDVQGTGEIGSCQYDTNQCLDCVACPDQDTECTALDQDCNDETGTAGICDYDATSATNAVYGCFTCYAVDPCPNTPDECTNIAAGTVGPCFITSTSSGMSTTVDGTCALDADGCYFCSETDPCANAYPSCTASTADCDVATMDSTGNWVGTGEVGTCVCTDSCCTCEPDATTTVDPNPDLCADEHPYCTTEGEFCDDVAMDAAGAWVGTGDSGSCEYDTNDCWICDADETTTSAPDATTTSASDPCATEATDCVSTGDTCAVSSDDGVTTTSEGICEMSDNRCWVCVERTDTTETPTDTTSASDTTASEDTTAAGDTTAAADTTAAGDTTAAADTTTAGDTTAAADTTASADTTAAGDTTADAGTTVAVDTSAVGTLHDPSSAAYRDHYMSIIAVLYAFSFLL
eukprot:285337_1